MKPFVWLGILLVTLGALALVYQASPTPVKKNSLMSDRFMQPQRDMSEFPFRQYSAAWPWPEGLPCWSREARKVPQLDNRNSARLRVG
jgi:hypothetical protein